MSCECPREDAGQTLPLTLVQTWVETTLEAWVTGVPGGLTKAVVAAERLRPSKDLLHKTGAGFLLRSDIVWGTLDARWQERRHRLLSSWKKTAQEDKTPLHGTAASPFQGLKAQGFRDAFESLLKSIQETPLQVPSSFEHRAVFTLMAKGFLHISHLDGVYPEQVMEWSDVPRVQCLLRTAIQRANELSRANRKRQFATLQPSQGEGQAVSSHEVAQALATASTLAVTQAEQGPGKTLAALTAMPASAADTVLQSAGVSLQVSSQLRSLPSVASGLRLWHEFAASLLRYAPEHTLPPQSSTDVVKFITLFRNAGTAANYISYIKWACVLNGLSVHWYTGQVTMALKGLKKQCASSLVGTLSEQKIFDEALVLKLMTLCDGLPNHVDIGSIFLLAWQFLLRGPSEAVPAQWGSEQDLHTLPVGRHSALWVDQQGVTSLRLRRRKNRPQGSLLRRPCLCSTVPNPMCIGHRLLTTCGAFVGGQRICQLTASQLLHRLHHLLAVLLVADPSRYKWKAFRAGKASAMAAAGQPLPKILQAGEWRSAAVLHYVDHDLLDAAAFLQELSDDDDD